MIWTLTTTFKCPCSAFFKNYVQKINDICGTLFSLFGRQRIQKKKNISYTSAMDNHLKIGAQNHKNYDLDPCHYA